MADPQRFFTEPTQTLHKRYEILRAHCVDQRPLADLAEQFGMNFYTVRSLVRAFHAQCQANQIPPFLSIRARDALASILPLGQRRHHKRRPWPTVVS